VKRIQVLGLAVMLPSTLTLYYLLGGYNHLLRVIPIEPIWLGLLASVAGAVGFGLVIVPGLRRREPPEP
jgi:hypothetical protein